MTENKSNSDDPEEQRGATNISHHGSSYTNVYSPGDKYGELSASEDVVELFAKYHSSALNAQGESPPLAQPQPSLHLQGEDNVDARGSTNTPYHSSPTSTSSLPSSGGDHHESPHTADSEASSVSSDRSYVHLTTDIAGDNSLAHHPESAESPGSHMPSQQPPSLDAQGNDIIEEPKDASGDHHPPSLGKTEQHKSLSLGPGMECDGPSPTTVDAVVIFDADKQGATAPASQTQPSRKNESSVVIYEDNASPPPKRKNIIVFGETGTGKSSLINMIAGDTVATVSNRAVGCTFGSASYPVTVGEELVTLWDTAGLNEGDNGTISPEQAILNLHDLVGRLQPDGLNLLVYCFRGTRFRTVLRDNYDMFCRSLCENKIPIVAVVTGLECEENREAWWRQNEHVFNANGMAFDAHACVTTFKGKKLEGGEHMFEEEYEHSRMDVQNLIEEYCRGESGKIDGGGLVGNALALLAKLRRRAAGQPERKGMRSGSDPKPGFYGIVVALYNLCISGVLNKL